MVESRGRNTLELLIFITLEVKCLPFDYRLEGKQGQQKAVPTEEKETLECGLVLRSIGYRGHTLDASLPFDPQSATIANVDGRVTGHSGRL